MNIEIVVGAIFVISIVFITVLEVVMRYIFNNSIIWVQEYIIMAFIWTVTLGASYALMGQSHIAIDTFSKYLPKRIQKLMKVVVSLIILGVLIYLAITLPPTINIQNRTKTSALPIKIPKGIYYTLPLLISVWTMIAAQLYYLFFQVRAFLGLPNPENFKLTGQSVISDQVKTEKENV
jgi:TRAP-type C4-dicarboxylate transport system permease small subunit